MKDKLTEVVWFSFFGGANLMITTNEAFAGKWLGALLGAGALIICFWFGRKNYMEVRNGITESSVPPSA